MHSVLSVYHGCYASSSHLPSGLRCERLVHLIEAMPPAQNDHHCLSSGGSCHPNKVQFRIGAMKRCLCPCRENIHRREDNHWTLMETDRYNVRTATSVTRLQLAFKAISISRTAFGIRVAVVEVFCPRRSGKAAAKHIVVGIR